MRRWLLTVDPGIRGAGVAIFDRQEQTLIRAEYALSALDEGNMALEARAVALEVREVYRRAVVQYLPDAVDLDLGVEWPRMLPAGQQKGDQNDLPALAGVSSAVAALFAGSPVSSFYPRDWKGTTEPDVVTKRIERRLSEVEAASVVWFGRTKTSTGGMMHNVFDAIGIGLHMFGRLKKQRVYAGVDDP